MSVVAKFENLKELIIELRGQSVLLDCDVAELYKVETKRVNEAVKNNPDKFPNYYMFEISEGEFVDLRSKFSTAKFAKTRALPKAITEKAMKVKFKTIGIRSSEDALKDAAEAMQSIVQGRKTQHVSACYFASMKAFHNVLTPKMYELLKVIRKSRPASVKELAAILGWDGSSVQADVDALVNMGIIELENHGEQRSPRVQ